MGDWLPIATAPKDGTVIGVWIKKRPVYVALVRWGHHLRDERSRPCWVSATHSLSISHLPTHWIPVPQLLPIETAEGSDGR